MTVPTGVIRYWAAAKEAAGIDAEPYAAETLGEALDAAIAARSGEAASALSLVFERSSYLVDGNPVGRRDRGSVQLPEGGTVEVLPPFAGG